MQRRIHRVLVSGLIFGSVAFAAFAALSESAESLLRRYPFDPACPWGRLANGKGTVVRCLSEKEGATLAAAAQPAPAALPSAPLASPPNTTTAAPAASGSAAPAASISAPGVAPAGRLEIAVGPVTADKGELPIGKLGVPKDRYAKCVEDNGGLKADTGEVHVRFLVRSKGIAEGVSVQKRFNVGPEAARCIAEVVDRRHVGVPDEPLVGATVIVKIARASER
jgi:hypothetical protein